MLNSLINSLQKLLPSLALRCRSPGCGDAVSRAVNHKILYDSLRGSRAKDPSQGCWPSIEAPGGIVGTGISAAQIATAPPPPPEAFEAYSKSRRPAMASLL